MMGVKEINYNKAYEEYLKLKEADDNCMYEFIDGEIYMSASPSTQHQMSLLNLMDVFRPFFKKSKCLTLVAPTDVYLENETEKRINAVIPDIFVICNKDGLENNAYHGIPKIIVEVVSNSSKINIRRDVVTKFNLYARYGVLEYWLVKPYEESITVYRLNTDTRHYETHMAAVDGEITSSLFPELKVIVEYIFNYDFV